MDARTFMVASILILMSIASSEGAVPVEAKVAPIHKATSIYQSTYEAPIETTQQEVEDGADDVFDMLLQVPTPTGEVTELKERPDDEAPEPEDNSFDEDEPIGAGVGDFVEEDADDYETKEFLEKQKLLNLEPVKTTPAKVEVFEEDGTVEAKEPKKAPTPVDIGLKKDKGATIALAAFGNISEKPRSDRRWPRRKNIDDSGTRSGALRCQRKIAYESDRTFRRSLSFNGATISINDRVGNSSLQRECPHEYAAKVAKLKAGLEVERNPVMVSPRLSRFGKASWRVAAPHPRGVGLSNIIDPPLREMKPIEVREEEGQDDRKALAKVYLKAWRKLEHIGDTKEDRYQRNVKKIREEIEIDKLQGINPYTNKERAWMSKDSLDSKDSF